MRRLRCNGWILVILMISLPQLSTAQIDHWETAVYAEDTWSYLPGTTEPSDAWRSITYNDTDWPTGAGSIGYGDGDDNTEIAPVRSLYMRRRFVISDLDKIEDAILHADYDDGFVAYLNGVEIARTNLEGTPPAYDADATDYREAEMYDGGLPRPFNLLGTTLEDILVEGENVLAVQTNNRDGLESSDLTTLYWLSFGINDDSNDYGPTPEWFFTPEFSTPLPIMVITTDGQEIPDEPRIAATMGIIWDSDGTENLSTAVPNEYLGNVAIEKRGQSSLDLFPKNGYAFETKDETGEDVDVEFLGLPPEEDWILHGPYSDKTLLRNVLAMELARNAGQYASRTRLVELIVNEQYEGVYVLMERIKRDEFRVDIANLNPEDISGNELTGGYIFKIDKDENDWYSNFAVVNDPERDLGFQYVTPKRDQIQPEQEAYLQAYVDSFEQAMVFPDGTFGGKRYDEYIDLESFADHFLLSELTKEIDAYRISSYYYKEKESDGGLLKAGPVWDFNLAFGNADYCEGDDPEGWIYEVHCGNHNPFWWQNMLEDEVFRNTLKCRWLDLREGAFDLVTIYDFIDEQVALVTPAVERNFQRWPILDQYVWPNPEVSGSYAGEIAYLKEYIADRIAWMDANVPGVCVTATEAPFAANHFSLFPNPTGEAVNLYYEDGSSTEQQIEIYDLLGRLVVGPIIKTNERNLRIDLRARGLQSGCYLVKLRENGRTIGTQRLVFNTTKK